MRRPPVSPGSPSPPPFEGAQGGGGPLLSFPPMPPGFRAEDFLTPHDREQLLPLPQAAEAMGISQQQAARMAGAGLLRAKYVGDVLYVRPALVTVAEVRP